MACGCQGSTKAQQQQRQRARTVPAREPRTGGPGEPGYYWTGPKRTRPVKPAA